MSDAEALADPELAPAVQLVAPVVNATLVTATFGGASHDVPSTTGTTTEYLTINNDTVAAGRAFSDTDYQAHSRVLLAGQTVAEALAGGTAVALSTR